MNRIERIALFWGATWCVLLGVCACLYIANVVKLASADKWEGVEWVRFASIFCAPAGVVMGAID